jgi:hypothetical protein
MERMGIVAEDMIDITVDRHRWVRGFTQRFSENILRVFPTRPIWDLQERHGAATGLRMAVDMAEGRGGLLDWLTARALDFDRPTATRLVKGEAKPQEYLTFARRFASRTNTTRMTLPAEESAFINNRFWRAWVWFARYPFMKGRTFGKDLANWYEIAAANPKELPAAKTKMLSAATYRVAKNIVGTAAAGATMHALLAAMSAGPQGIGVLARDWREHPVRMFWTSWGAAMFGPVITSIMRIQFNRDINAWWRSAAAASLVADILSAFTPGGLNDYADLPIVARMNKLIWRYLPGPKTVIQTAAVFGIGSRDPKLEHAIGTLYRWRREYGLPVKRTHWVQDEETNRKFRFEMRLAIEDMKDRDPWNEKNVAEIQEHLAKALEIKAEEMTPVKAKAAIASALRARRLVSRLEREEREDFIERYGEELFLILREYDSVLDKWAFSFGRMTPAQ